MNILNVSKLIEVKVSSKFNIFW